MQRCVHSNRESLRGRMDGLSRSVGASISQNKNSVAKDGDCVGYDHNVLVPAHQMSFACRHNQDGDHNQQSATAVFHDIFCNFTVYFAMQSTEESFHSAVTSGAPYNNSFDASSNLSFHHSVECWNVDTPVSVVRCLNCSDQSALFDVLHAHSAYTHFAWPRILNVKAA